MKPFLPYEKFLKISFFDWQIKREKACNSFLDVCLPCLNPWLYFESMAIHINKFVRYSSFILFFNFIFQRQKIGNSKAVQKLYENFELEKYLMPQTNQIHTYCKQYSHILFLKDFWKICKIWWILKFFFQTWSWYHVANLCCAVNCIFKTLYVFNLMKMHCSN